MFSPTGSKKQMLLNLIESQRTGKDIQQLVKIEETRARSASNSSEIETRERSASHTSGHGKEKASVDTLIRQLSSTESSGCALRKMAKAAAEFSIDRDGILLQAFKTCSVNYSDFRMLIKRIFKVEFTNSEYNYMCQLFDANGDETIDGDEFLVCFKLLSSAWKSANNKATREKFHDLEVLQAEELERQAKEMEEERESAVDFNFSEEQNESALEKIKHAAQKYFPQDQSVKSVPGFDARFLSPVDFRDLIKNTFAVFLSRGELGAAVRLFDNGSGLVETKQFLLKFTRMGLDMRNDQRLHQIEMIKRTEAEQRKAQELLLATTSAKLEISDDVTFCPADQDRALAKIRAVAATFSKDSSGCSGLEIFEAVHLAPGIFRDACKRSFDVFLSDSELAALMDYFPDPDHPGKILTKPFLVYFNKIGLQEKNRQWEANLKRSRDDMARYKEKQTRQLFEVTDTDLPDDITEEDNASFFAKLREAAASYKVALDGTGLLSAFLSGMPPLLFRDCCKRCLSVSLSKRELAAAVTIFDLNGDKSTVDCEGFLKKFKALVVEEKEKMWINQRERKEKALKELEDYKDKIGKKHLKTVDMLSIINLNFDEEDKESAAAKLRLGAASFDRSHPSAAAKLRSFEVAIMPAKDLRDLLRKSFEIDLNPREMGAVMEPYMMEDGDIRNSEFIIKFFELSRQERARIRSEVVAEKIRQQQALLGEERRQAAASKAKDESAVECRVDDERSLLRKLRKASQDYAIDSPSFSTKLQTMKGLVFTPKSFGVVFYRAFLIKLTLPEIGVLMGKVNPEQVAAKLFILDGTRFLRSFYKFVRTEEKFLLGILPENAVSLDLLSPESKSIVGGGGGSSPGSKKLSCTEGEGDVGFFVGENEACINTDTPTVGFGDRFRGALGSKAAGQSVSPSLINILLRGANPWNEGFGDSKSQSQSGMATSPHREQTARRTSTPSGGFACESPSLSLSSVGGGGTSPGRRGSLSPSHAGGGGASPGRPTSSSSSFSQPLSPLSMGQMPRGVRGVRDGEIGHVTLNTNDEICPARPQTEGSPSPLALTRRGRDAAHAGHRSRSRKRSKSPLKLFEVQSYHREPDALAKLTRPSLPTTFSSLGFARRIKPLGLIGSVDGNSIGGGGELL